MVFQIDILRKILKRMCHGIRGQFFFPESAYLFKKVLRNKRIQICDSSDGNFIFEIIHVKRLSRSDQKRNLINSHQTADIY